jgi:hypothetical protein
MKKIAWGTSLIVVLSIGILTQCSVFNRTVDYNADVKPILNKKCISCHGGVKQSGGFSLLTEEAALAVSESGKPSIIPGNAAESEMIKRLTLEDPEERMPYESPPLSADEIRILTAWVNQGAKWGLHWSYEPLQPVQETTEMGVGASSQTSISREIDHFISEKHKEKDLQANSRASQPELLRRASLTLTGLPPSSSISEKFLAGVMPYDELLDSLLASPSYGEKWSSMWLDIARYADTKGFERDGGRNIWKYRDYVVDAFNNNKPYNTFLIEQLAGDLYANPTDEQLIATGFHRNTQTNDEGGTDNEEFRVQAVMDRVSTTWDGILGTTMACVQCHGHPYDPFPQEDYYTTFAFFNNTRDADTYMDYPRLEFLDSIGSEKLNELTTWVENVAGEESAKEINMFVRTTQPVIYSIETTDFINADLYDTKYLGIRNNGSAKIEQVSLTGKERLWVTIQSAKASGVLTIRRDSLDGEILTEWRTGPKDNRGELIELPIAQTEGIHDLYLTYYNPTINDEKTRGISFDYFAFTGKFPGEGSTEAKSKKQLFIELVQKQYPSTLIMIENPEELRRKSYLFDRGNWQMHEKEVKPAVPDVLPPLNAEGEVNRMDFAKWVADESNPLTARTYVNRIWEQVFGRGIARTVEDLGSQGDLPSHPRLINYLASEFMYKQNWSTKALLKSILLTETFQRSAKTNSKDPNNIFLASGPSFRLSAEQIRDQALSVAGLLSDEMYGPPVMPYQPEGVWSSPYSGDKWVMSKGDDKYRRALYTFVKRTAIYPSLETYDMATRQVCTSRRIRTNTPLQALVTLNDPVYVEASEALAKRMLNSDGDLKAQISYGYELGMFKKLSQDKLDILEQLYHDTAKEWEQTKKLSSSDSDNLAIDVEVGDTTDKESTEVIAMTAVANTILNLDEMLNN